MGENAAPVSCGPRRGSRGRGWSGTPGQARVPAAASSSGVSGLALGVSGGAGLLSQAFGSLLTPTHTGGMHAPGPPG